jgi:hypothetical protein
MVNNVRIKKGCFMFNQLIGFTAWYQKLPQSRAMTETYILPTLHPFLQPTFMKSQKKTDFHASLSTFSHDSAQVSTFLCNKELLL